MSSYPLGGIEIQNEDIRAVEVANNLYSSDTFLPATSGKLYTKGLILGRLTASPFKVTPFNPAGDADD